jgi:signal transduction histidine kinase
VFNAEMVTHFEKGLEKVNIIPQDIGRVLLNLYNNAFYAVNQRAKTEGPKYKPKVELTTKLFTPPSGGREVEISVKDNGNGIPDAIRDKIMQPFFTTKPTGEGTGLGLSLSYDIVIKGHGGSITVDTKEGEFTEFIIQLPNG